MSPMRTGDLLALCGEEPKQAPGDHLRKLGEAQLVRERHEPDLSGHGMRGAPVPVGSKEMSGHPLCRRRVMRRRNTDWIFS